MEIKAIKCSDGFFLETNHKLQFVEERPVPTWKQGWVKVSQINSPVFTVIPARTEVAGYRLKEGITPSEVLPQEVDADYFYYDYKTSEMEHGETRGVYEPINKEIPEVLEPVEVEIKIIAEVEGELVEKKLEFPVYGQYPNLDGKNWKITNQQVEISLIDEITVPGPLKTEVPCRLSAENSYKIIRTHIKDNINPKVAHLTSDYDFCLTVSKKISLAETEEYMYDANLSFFGRKKKPKMTKGYRTERKLEVYEVAPKAYQKYTVVEPFEGKDTAELQANIDYFLTELMKEINRPLKDCPTCKGHGVIETHD